MNVLIIDDQEDVVKGIIDGVKWKLLGVDTIFKAYDANEARRIFSAHIIDIMLCDIEMPVENGLSLLKWVREKKHPTECIFLTAHAEFSYAQEAISLNSYDYIVQPAPYQLIEDTIRQVILKIRMNQKRLRFYDYGKLMDNKKEAFLNTLYKQLFHQPGSAAKEVLHTLEPLGIHFSASTAIHQCRIELINWSQQKSWDTYLLQYAIKNILSELLTPNHHSVLVYTENTRHSEILIYTSKESALSKEILKKLLQLFKTTIERFLQCTCAIYIRPNSTMAQTSQTYQALEQQAQENVGNVGKIFFIDQPVVRSAKTSTAIPDMTIWEKMIETGGAQGVYEEATRYLSRSIAEERLNKQNLKHFYNEFIKMVYRLAARKQLSIDEIFSDSKLTELMYAYTDADKVLALIQYVVAYFNQADEHDFKKSTQVDLIKQYIYDHLDEPILRSDIASALFLNPNYISRIFKSETGMSLKDFMAGVKMKLARNLLLSTNLPISVIAQRIGYTNFSHFSQVYKKTMNMSPTEERENRK